MFSTWLRIKRKQTHTDLVLFTSKTVHLNAQGDSLSRDVRSNIRYRYIFPSITKEKQQNKGWTEN